MSYILLGALNYTIINVKTIVKTVLVLTFNVKTIVKTVAPKCEGSLHLQLDGRERHEEIDHGNNNTINHIFILVNCKAVHHL